MTPSEGILQVATAHAAISFSIDPEGRLLQHAFGARDRCEPGGQDAFPVSGNGWVFEPAMSVVHADGNTSTDLRVVRWAAEGDVVRIELKDPQYPFYVDLLFRAIQEDDVLESWTVVRHGEEGPVALTAFGSSAPDFGKGEFWLTQFHGDWAAEAGMAEEKLGYGLKVLDSKLGVRAHQFRAPWFLLARDRPAQEDEGEVFGGSLAWSGSFRFSFEVLPTGRLRAACGVNPFGSTYHLDPGETLETPKMVWA
ncbi:MAG TPA: glycoside hydrolase family 36 N-terminal domain-containing protein, partial [Fimbriimonas sp.]